MKQFTQIYFKHLTNLFAFVQNWYMKHNTDQNICSCLWTLVTLKFGHKRLSAFHATPLCCTWWWNSQADCIHPKSENKSLEFLFHRQDFWSETMKITTNTPKKSKICIFSRSIWKIVFFNLTLLCKNYRTV